MGVRVFGLILRSMDAMELQFRDSLVFSERKDAEKLLDVPADCVLIDNPAAEVRGCFA